MQYILDFDDTLFDTKRFKESVKEYSDTASWANPTTWEAMDSKSFLFDDTISFLAGHRGEVAILTAFNPSLGPEAEAFQRVKVEQSGVLDFVDQVVYVSSEKGEFLEELCSGDRSVFVDDKLSQLRSAKTHCPEITLLQMVRPGLEGVLETSKEIPVIHSLTEIADLSPKK